MKHRFWVLILPCLLMAMGLASCGNDDDDDNDNTDITETTGFVLESANFAPGGVIPNLHACDIHEGDNVSPALMWSGAPAGTSSYALIVDDETAPCGTDDEACKHWMVYNIPASVTSLAEGVAATELAGVTEGTSYTGEMGYAGPCPPPNDRHTYQFTLYALDEAMPLIASGEGLTRSEFESEYGEHILGSTTLTATYTPQ